MAISMASTRTATAVAGMLVDDQKLVAGLREGDSRCSSLVARQLREDRLTGGSDGLTIIGKAFRDKIVPFLARMLGDAACAEEAWNDTLLRVFLRIDAYDPRKGSLRTTVFNHAIVAGRELRKERAHQRRGDAVGVTTESPESGRETGETRAMNRAFSRLTPQEREILRLRHIEQLGNVELVREGLLRDVPEEHVRVYAHRALAKLRRLYEEEIRGDGAAPH